MEDIPFLQDVGERESVLLPSACGTAGAITRRGVPYNTGTENGSGVSVPCASTVGTPSLTHAHVQRSTIKK